MEMLLLLIGPVVTATVTAGSVWLREVQQRRDRQHRRRRAIEQANQELALIDAWLTAYERLRGLQLHAAMTQRVTHDLEKAYSVLAAPVVAEPIVTESVRSRWKISTFLLRDVRRGWAKFVRFFYYVFLILAAIWSVASFAGQGAEGSRSGTSFSPCSWRCSASCRRSARTSSLAGSTGSVPPRTIVAAREGAHRRWQRVPGR